MTVAAVAACATSSPPGDGFPDVGDAAGADAAASGDAATSGSGSGSGSGGPGTDAPPGAFSDGSSSSGAGDVGASDGPPECAEDIEMAQRVPLDLALLIDRSSSMAGSKWDMASAALKSFVGDPRSAGLGVGLQFLPVSEVDHVCAADIDCGTIDATCVERQVCTGVDLSGVSPPTCGGAGDAPCAGPATCVPLGECSLSSAYCTAAGAPCPGGPTDVCTALGKTCRMADFSESCLPDPYAQRLNVPIGPLPLAAAALARAIDAVTPEGGTPMAQAVKGTLTALRAHLAANPTHRVVLILATDGVPSNCGDFGGAATPEAAITMALDGARATAPSISTYAIGVFAPGEDPAGPMFVDSIAASGGTGTAFVLDPTKDLTQELLDALSRIRGSALPCSFTIPPPKSGAIDFGKVNVHFQSPGGQKDIPYVGSAARCDPTRGGWYYDVDPATADPTQVIVCDATCAAFKADLDGTVEIGFGCKTQVIQ